MEFILQLIWRVDVFFQQQFFNLDYQQLFIEQRRFFQ